MLRRIFPRNVRAILLRRKPMTTQAALGVDSSSSTSRSCSNSNNNDNVANTTCSLKRSLSAVDLILYGVGCSVGAGIYSLVGIGAQVAGPGIALSFLICGISCIFTALSYAEFAARIPATGSAYLYMYVSFGEFCGWMTGWFLTLGYGFTASVVARSWAEYVASFLRSTIDALSWTATSVDNDTSSSSSSDSIHHAVPLEYLTKLPLSFVWKNYTCSPLSIVIIAICTLVNVLGAKESSRFNNSMTFLNLSVLSFVVLTGLGTEAVDMDNLSPFLPHGIPGVASGAGLVFFAFIGFDMVACLSEEVIHPERNMPIGIVGSLLICTFIYVTVSLVVVGMAPVDLLGPDVPIANAFLANACCTHQEQLADNAPEQCLMHSMCSTTVLQRAVQRVLLYGGRFVSFGAIFGLTSGTFTSLMGQPRIFYKMAQDGLFFPIFCRIDERTHVPTAGMVITGVLAAFLACFVELSALAELISLGTLMVYTFVGAGVIILRLSPSTDEEQTECSGSAPQTDRSEGNEETSYLVPHTSFPSSEQAFENQTGQKVGNNGSKPIIFTALFTTSAVLGFASIHNKWAKWCSFVFFLAAFISALGVMHLPRSPAPDTFGCPCVPFIPLLGILGNSYMMGSIPLSAWGFSIVWFAIGTGLYFTYGVWHSELGRVNRNEGTEENKALCIQSGQCSDGYGSTVETNLPTRTLFG